MATKKKTNAKKKSAAAEIEAVADARKRCAWISSDLMRTYHDVEWGVPLRDDRKLFEFLVLEGMQAGLSWSTILNKRENYRAAFDGFDPEKIARYGDRKIASLLKDAGIIRNRQKINACVKNAKAFLDIVDKEGSFTKWSWAYVNDKPIINRRRGLKSLPAKTPLSEKFSADLIKRGFSFVGPTVVYAHMQATGMVNDHLVTCFRWAEVQR
jgi:DNA-3-methyladenine glycosylase I